MADHIKQDALTYSNDVIVDSGDNDSLVLISTREDRDVHNYNYTQIASKLRELQSKWQSLTPAATIEYDVDNGVNAKLPSPAAGNEVGPLVNAVDGMTGQLFIQGSSNNPTWDSSWDFGDAGTPTLTTDTGKMDLISWVQKGSSTIAVAVTGFTNA